MCLCCSEMHKPYGIQLHRHALCFGAELLMEVLFLPQQCCPLVVDIGNTVFLNACPQWPISIHVFRGNLFHQPVNDVLPNSRCWQSTLRQIATAFPKLQNEDIKNNFGCR